MKRKVQKKGSHYRKLGKSEPKNRRKQKDVVNQAAKVAPGVINEATNDIDLMVKNRLNHAITSGGAGIERVLPKILRGAIEDVYKTPFRLLGKFEKEQFNKIKKKILR